MQNGTKRKSGSNFLNENYCHEKWMKNDYENIFANAKCPVSESVVRGVG